MEIDYSFYLCTESDMCRNYDSLYNKIEDRQNAYQKNIVFIHKKGFIMKLAAKIFIILGMVFGFYTILPLIFGFIALSKLKKAEKKADFSTGWAVVVLLFVNIVAGILLLVMKDEDFVEKKAE